MNHGSCTVTMLAVMVLSGCSHVKSYEELNASHASTAFDGKMVSDMPWSIDQDSFFIAHRIEIFPSGGKEQYDNWVSRGVANFYPTFLENSEAMMESLFGSKSSGDKGEMITLSVEILSIECGWNLSGIDYVVGRSDTPYSIKLRFSLTKRETGKLLAQATTEGNKVSKNGNAYQNRARSHERANEAINMAFKSARELLQNQLIDL